MNFLQKLVDHRAKVLPVTELLIVPFRTVGTVFGGAYGFSQSLSESNGVVWRPTLGAACGGVVGFTVGLFPYQTFGLLLAVDAMYTVFPKIGITM